MRPLLPILLLPTLFAASAQAETLAVCDIGGPGSTKQAQPALDKFLRHIEKTAGLQANSLSGAYHTEAEDCAAYLEKSDPFLVVFDLPTYLQKAGAMALRPVAHLGAPDAERYRVVVKKGTAADLDALKGKTLISAHLRDPRFAGKVIFAGEVDPAKHFQLKQTERPLKAIRAVARGKAEAALLDAETFGHIGDLQLPEPLVAVFTSEPVPDLVMAAVKGGDEKKALVEKVRAALPKLCAGEGADLCENFGIDRIVPAEAERLKALRARYDG